MIARIPLTRKWPAAVEEALATRFAADLNAADVVSLHVPGGPETERLIDAAALAKMRSGGFLINTARGSVIDEDALVRALNDGTIGGAGLDVFVGEPQVAPGLLAAPNLVTLPHLGSATRESREAMGLRAIANLEAWLTGREPPDRVA